MRNGLLKLYVADENADCNNTMKNQYNILNRHS